MTERLHFTSRAVTRKGRDRIQTWCIRCFYQDYSWNFYREEEEAQEREGLLMMAESIYPCHSSAPPWLSPPLRRHTYTSSSCPWEKAMAPHSSTLAWRTPWTEESGGLQSMGLLRVGHD